MICPYCYNEVSESDIDNGEMNDESEIYEVQCPHCKKYLACHISFVKYYDLYELPCANGEDHKWNKVNGFPEEYYHEVYRCEYCGDEECRDNEGRQKRLIQYGIKLEKDYENINWE